MYQLIRIIDDEIYGDIEHFETIEDALDEIMSGIAHCCHCDVGALAPIDYDIDLKNRQIIKQIARNQYYKIVPTNDHEEIEYLSARYHTDGHHL